MIKSSFQRTKTMYDTDQTNEEEKDENDEEDENRTNVSTDFLK